MQDIETYIDNLPKVEQVIPEKLTCAHLTERSTNSRKTILRGQVFFKTPKLILSLACLRSQGKDAASTKKLLRASVMANCCRMLRGYCLANDVNTFAHLVFLRLRCRRTTSLRVLYEAILVDDEFLNKCNYK